MSVDRLVPVERQGHEGASRVIEELPVAAEILADLMEAGQHVEVLPYPEDVQNGG